MSAVPETCIVPEVSAVLGAGAVPEAGDDPEVSADKRLNRLISFTSAWVHRYMMPFAIEPSLSQPTGSFNRARG